MNIQIPQFIFGSLIAGLIGALIHLILGGSILRIVFSLSFSWVGFWAGHFFANRLNFKIFRLGTINLGLAIITAICMSIFGYWIAGDNKRNEEA